MTKCEIALYVRGIETALVEARKNVTKYEFDKIVVSACIESENFFDEIKHATKTDVETYLYALQLIHRLGLNFLS